MIIEDTIPVSNNNNLANSRRSALLIEDKRKSRDWGAITIIKHEGIHRQYALTGKHNLLLLSCDGTLITCPG